MKVLALCKNYNNHRNVLFMMDSDDFRLTDHGYKPSTFSKNYVVQEPGQYDRRRRILTTDSGKRFEVYADSSLALISIG
jgi:hypothetical protein